MYTILDNSNFNIQEWVNLNSYTDTKGWKGYCKRNKPFTIFRANNMEIVSGSIYDNPNCLSLGFKKILDVDYDIISMFSLLMMMDEGIDGHCFFVFDKLGLIAYPHDDTGFGFIRIKNTKVHYEDVFLKNVSQFSDFISVW